MLLWGQPESLRGHQLAVRWEGKGAARDALFIFVLFRARDNELQITVPLLGICATNGEARLPVAMTTRGQFLASSAALV